VGIMHIRDLRTNKETKFGNAVVLEGDFSLCCITTDLGFRFVIDGYNLKQISDYYLSKNIKGMKANKTRGE
jgi:hypothetical protein